MKLDDLIKAATAAAPVLSNNTALPALPAWKARSFWLTVITMLVALASSFGVDLMAIFTDLGLGASPDVIVDNAGKGVSAI